MKGGLIRNWASLGLSLGSRRNLRKVLQEMGADLEGVKLSWN